MRERKWGQQPTTQVVFEDTKTKMYNPYANMAAARREDVTAMREERVAREMAREGNYAAAIALEQDAQRHRAVASVERAVAVNQMAGASPYGAAPMPPMGGCYPTPVMYPGGVMYPGSTPMMYPGSAAVGLEMDAARNASVARAEDRMAFAALASGNVFEAIALEQDANRHRRVARMEDRAARNAYW